LSLHSLHQAGRGSDSSVTKPFSLAFKQKMVEQLTGRDAVSARSLARGTGISQETLLRWLREAHSLPLMGPRRHKSKTWSIDEKVRVLVEAKKLSGSELNSLLEREGLLLAELEQWRLALDEEGRASYIACAFTQQACRKGYRALYRRAPRLFEDLVVSGGDCDRSHSWS
jgi:transposase-like protein